MSEEFTPTQKILWTSNASTREQVLMLKLLDLYGGNDITGNLHDIARLLGVKRSLLITILKGLRDLGWLETEKAYEKNVGNLPKVAGVQIKFTI